MFHTATVRWERGDAAFTDRRYSRAHVWAFDGGLEVKASASPLNVRTPLSDPNAVDPEEAFVAAVSSCHMLFFLDYAAQAGFAIDRYEDTATGTIAQNGRGKAFVQTIVLAPRVAFSGPRQPTPAQIAALHERSNDDCFIANSIVSEIRIVPPAPAD